MGQDRLSLVTEIEDRRGEPAAIVGLPNAHIPDRDGMCLQSFVHVYGQAGIILREAGFAGVLCCSQRRIEATSAKGVPKLNLRELRRPRIEYARQSERGRFEWVTLDNVPSGIANEEQVRCSGQESARRHANSPKLQTCGCSDRIHKARRDRCSVKGPRLDLSLMLVRELPVDSVIRIDVVVDANSPLVGSGRCARRGVEVEAAARILRRRPVVSRRKLVRQGVDCPYTGGGE